MLFVENIGDNHGVVNEVMMMIMIMVMVKVMVMMIMMNYFRFFDCWHFISFLSCVFCLILLLKFLFKP